MKRKAITLLLSMILIFTIVFAASPAFAVEKPDPAKTTEICNACMLVDATSGSVLFASDNAGEKIFPASTTKILTAAIVVDKANLDEVVVCGPEVEIAGSKLGLVQGEEVTVRELLAGMMLVSGNDCAVVLAKHIGGSIEGFAELMNDKAKAIGMDNSHFVTPNGLHNEEHYVTCEDMAKLMLYVEKNYPVVNEIASAKTYTFSANNKRGEDYEKRTTNKLLLKLDNDPVDYTYQYATGYKTGSTPAAGGCLVATAEKDGTKLISLVYGVADESPEKNRWDVTRFLFDYGFENFTTKDVYSLMAGRTVNVTVNNAVLSDRSKGMKEIACTANIPEGTLCTVDKIAMEQNELTIDFRPSSPTLEAPVYEGDVVGTVTLRYGDSGLGEYEVVATENALDTVEEYEKIEGPVSQIEQIDLELQKKRQLTQAELRSLWWLLIIPAAAIVALIVVFVVKNNKRRGMGYITKKDKAAQPQRSRYRAGSSAQPRRPQYQPRSAAPQRRSDRRRPRR